VCPLNSCCIDKESLWKWLSFNHMGFGLKVACEMQYKCKHSGCADVRNNNKLDQGAGKVMNEQSVRLGPREKQIVELLLQGCDNAEIAKQLKMARRTVKAHFNRLFLRFGITDGIKRVKLATLLYRRQSCSPTNATETVSRASENAVSLN
jgi:DNA-binding NarL/FixJ family response regulator